VGEIFPQRLHGREFLVETHVFEGKFERHGGSIPQGRLDSNAKLTAHERKGLHQTFGYLSPVQFESLN
jgi:hypothetical protein